MPDQTTVTDVVSAMIDGFGVHPDSQDDTEAVFSGFCVRYYLRLEEEARVIGIWTTPDDHYVAEFDSQMVDPDSIAGVLAALTGVL